MSYLSSITPRHPGKYCYGVTTLWLFIAVISEPTFSQTYKSNPYVSRSARVVKDSVKSGTTYAAEKERFNQYFLEYYFPLLTQAKPEDLGNLGKRRYDFFRQYMWPAESKELQADLTEMTSFDVSRNQTYR